MRNRTKIFISLYVFLNSLAISVHIFTSSYFNYKMTEVLSLHTGDGWCTPSTQGIGDHCFSDFYYLLHFVNMRDPWSTDPNPVPPIVDFFSKPLARQVQNNPTSSLGIKLFLLLLICGALLPTLHAFYTKRISGFVAIALVAATLNMAPLLVGIDRGNYVVLCIPFLYFFYIGILDSRLRLAFFMGFLLVLLKPQMILLGFIFFANRQWKLGIKWLGLMLGGTALTLFLYPQGLFRNTFDFIGQLLFHQYSDHQGDLSPINVSFSNTLAIFWSFISKLHFAKPLVSFISLAVCVLAGISLFVLGKYRSTFHNLLIVTCLPILVPGVAYNYYLVLLIVPLLFVAIDFAATAKEPKGVISSEQSSRYLAMRIFSSRWVGTIFAGTYLLLFIPWAIPWSVITGNLNGVPSPITGVNWVIGQFFLVILFLSLLLTAE